MRLYGYMAGTEPLTGIRQDLLQKRHTQRRWNGDVSSGLWHACRSYGISRRNVWPLWSTA